MTLNERLLEMLTVAAGEDLTLGMLLTMFRGNFLSIPEGELRTNLRRYLRVLSEALDE